jgi:hypothetical protein
MSGSEPRWDAASASALMDYVRRASPRYVEAELDKLGLLQAADAAAATIFDDVAPPAHRQVHASIWMVALAMCAMLVVLGETLHAGAINVLPDDEGTFMQLAGPTSEW